MVKILKPNNNNKKLLIRSINCIMWGTINRKKKMYTIAKQNIINVWN